MIHTSLSYEPFLIEAHAAPRVEACLNAMVAFFSSDPRGQKILAGGVSGDENDDDFWPDDDDDGWLTYIRPYDVSNGTLNIPVQGVLLNNFPYQLGGYATGYEYIERAFTRGMNDPAVQRVALVIDSPGGMVAGCFDCTDLLSASAAKPTRAFAADSAYSAAYAIASVADQISVTRTGGVGSIGVVTMHVDYSGMMAKAGIKVTYISAPEGGFKTEGNPYEPLSDEAAARLQARINSLYQVFVSTVATNRDMTADAVVATQALCFSAGDAVANGLADTVSRLDTGLAAFAAETPPTTGVYNMAITQEDLDKAVIAASTHGVAEGRKEGAVSGAAAERTRINTIMNCAEAAKRPSAARSFALETSMTADEAVAVLKKIPEEKAVVAAPTEEEARRAAFEAAMARDNPGLHASGGGSEGGPTLVETIVADYARSGGATTTKRSAVAA